MGGREGGRERRRDIHVKGRYSFLKWSTFNNVAPLTLLISFYNFIFSTFSLLLTAQTLLLVMNTLQSLFVAMSSPRSSAVEVL